jgi:DNA-binding MarR family transcriptional regulator
METLGWTRREAVPGDRRAWRVVPTAKGRRLWAKVAPRFEQAVLAAVGPLGAVRVQGTLEALRQLETTAEAVAADAGARARSET